MAFREIFDLALGERDMRDLLLLRDALRLSFDVGDLLLRILLHAKRALHLHQSKQTTS